jgi:hypothetical protein
MDISLLLAFPAVQKVIDVVRYLVSGTETQWKETATVVGSWVVGVGVVALVASSSFAEQVGLTGATLSDLILYGIGVGSSAGVVHDFTNGGVDIR